MVSKKLTKKNSDIFDSVRKLSDERNAELSRDIDLLMEPEAMKQILDATVAKMLEISPNAFAGNMRIEFTITNPYNGMKKTVIR